MRERRSSFTAAFVAACRGLAPLLPAEARLAHDPFGARFAGRAVAAAARLLAASPGLALIARVALFPLLPWIAYMQVRTRALDDLLLGFVAGGGRQVVILGAGFDCRAARFADRLAGASVIEVDHPATQARKREGVGAASGAAYLAWDFERDDLAALGDRLRALGHDPARPTLTLWEGVTMYLSEGAIEATLRAVAGYSAPGSLLGMNYFERRYLQRPSLARRLVMLAVRGAGEPWRFGWNREELPAWLAERAFTLRSDEGFDEAAARLLPARYAAQVGPGRRLAVAERAADERASSQ